MSVPAGFHGLPPVAHGTFRKEGDAKVAGQSKAAGKSGHGTARRSATVTGMTFGPSRSHPSPA